MTWTSMFGVLAVATATLAYDTPTVNLGKDSDGNDVLMPVVGAGSWEYNDTVAYDSYCKAFALGYNMIDTANGYGNEEGVGRAIKDCWLDAGKAREGHLCVRFLCVCVRARVCV